jgi:hypothetical protein
MVGFATYVVHECTWEVDPVCYVEDAYLSKGGAAKHRACAMAGHLPR